MDTTINREETVDANQGKPSKNCADQSAENATVHYVLIFIITINFL